MLGHWRSPPVPARQYGHAPAGPAASRGWAAFTAGASLTVDVFIFGVRPCGFAAVFGLVVEELADQVFQHHGRLRGRDRIPGRQVFSSAPASMPMYCSPSKPLVKIFSELSLGKAYDHPWTRSRAPERSLSSNVMDSTRPTTTPLALRTAAWGLRPPMLSKPRTDAVTPEKLKQVQQVGRLQRQEHQRHCPSITNNPTPHIVFGALHADPSTTGQ